MKRGRILVPASAALVVFFGCGTSHEEQARRLAEHFKAALLDPNGDPCRFLEPALADEKNEGLGETCAERVRAKYARRARGPIRVERVYEDSDLMIVYVQPMDADAEIESLDDDDSEGVRFELRRDQARAFVLHAIAVVNEGRPTCQLCGLPIDPEGHRCPASNGHRPN
jgi:hypothetical protein